MKNLPQLLIYICLLVLPAMSNLSAQTTLVTRDVVTELDTPWELIWGPDNWIWMTERYGRISRVNPETGQVQALLTVSEVYENFECGLLGMALHPNFSTDPYVYIAYTYRISPPSTQVAVRIARYRYNGTSLVEPIALREGVNLASTIHAGSRLLIDPDGKLIVTMGDGGNAAVAQSLTSFSGKILRMNLDGSVPADNPWSTAPSPQSYFWTIGHRNPQGMVYGPNGKLYISEHGPDEDDEVNIVTQSRNYGWPQVTGTCDLPAEQSYCNDWNVMEPIAWWTPTLAVAGIDYYNHPSAIPEWKNSILMTTLKEQELRVLKLSADGSRVDTQLVYYNNVYGRLRDVCVAPDGRVFISTSNQDQTRNPKPGDDRIVEIKNHGTSLSLSEVTIGRDVYTAGDTATVFFKAAGTYPPDNFFIAQLSDSAGSFANPVEIGRVRNFESNGKGIIISKLPCDMTGSNRYKIRVITNNPMFSVVYSGLVAIGPRAAISIQVESTNRICYGDSVVLSVPAGYKSYRWNNGDTTHRIVVYEEGVYSVKITDIGDCITNAKEVAIQVIYPPDELVITSSSPTSFCEGDSVTLIASPGGASYLWTNGSTERSIVVKHAGSYGVTVRTPDGCNFAIEPVDVVVYSLPAPVAVYSGNTLDAGSEYAGYQWHRDGSPIDGATARVYVPTVTGSYSVTVTSGAGCSATSSPVPVVIPTVSVPLEHVAGGTVMLAPSPVRDVLNVTIAGGNAGMLEITMIDMNGRTVMTFTDRKSSAAYSRDLSMKGLAVGAYIIRISDGRGVWTEKVVKE